MAVQIGGKSVTFSPLKGKGADAVAANKLIGLANQQPTFGAALAAVGIGAYNKSRAVQYAVKSMLDDLVDADILGPKTNATLQGALMGFPDATFIPGGMTTAVVMAANPVVGVVYAIYESQYITVQEFTGSDWTVEKALNWVASNTDPAAADLLADAILEQQASFAEKYHTSFASAFAKNAWRGAKMALQELVDAGKKAVDVATEILPWWAQLAIAGALAFGVYSWVKRPGGA